MCPELSLNVKSEVESSVYACVQAAQNVLVALCTLNTPLFSVMLRTIPKTFQVIL